MCRKTERRKYIIKVDEDRRTKKDRRQIQYAHIWHDIVKKEYVKRLKLK